MVYPPVSPHRGRFDDNPFEKFRIQRSDRGSGGILAGPDSSSGFRARKRYPKTKVIRLVLIAVAVFCMLGMLWNRRDGSVQVADGKKDRSAEVPKANIPEKPAETSPARPRGKEQWGKEKATLVMLVRNRELKDALQSMKQIEDRFNREYRYPWTFLNDEPFTDEFIEWTTKRASGKTEYGLIPKAQWTVPDHIDTAKLQDTLKDMTEKQVIYGDSVPYRHMCRYNSGFFWRHELLEKYNWYWRVEPGIGFYCDQEYDPFTFMRENNKKYSFVVSLPEYPATIETLWKTTKEFVKLNPQYLAGNNSLGFIVDNDKGLEGDYNMCHFWSNFEIGDLSFWRSEAYTKYFEFLDQKGGFYYERWGDAPVHSIAAALFLDNSELHWFNDIGYKHNPFARCPFDTDATEHARCVCPFEESENFDADGYSCMPKWWKFKGIDKNGK